MPRPTSAADVTPVRVVIVTMDTHLASATDRARRVLARELPGLSIVLHAATEFSGDDDSLADIRKILASRDGPILPILTDEREASRLQYERHVCIDTTAAGGNASLIASAS